MENFFKSYFQFSKTERIVLIFLIFCITALIVCPKIIFRFSLKNLSVTDQELIQNLKIKNQSTTSKFKTYPSFNNNKSSKKVQEFHPFPFNPNEVNQNTLLKLGFSEKQTQMILNYINKGGHFYKKEDFKKLYCITDDIYQQIEAYLVIPQTVSSQPSTSPNKVIKLEINTADTLALFEIPKMSKSLAKRIFRYREQLGGFYKIEQLLEVYKMDTVKYHLIKNYFIIDKNHITKLKINQADYKTLIQHPYMDAYLVKSILSYRKRFQKIPNALTLKEYASIHEELYQKLIPYLNFE